MRKFDKQKIEFIKDLRMSGQSLPDISESFYHTFRKRIAPGTIWHYVKEIKLSKEQQERLQQKKRDNSPKKCKNEWKKAIQSISRYLQEPLSDREKLLIVSMLYWGEGQKRDLNICNGDPVLLCLFKECIKDVLKIPSERFTFNLLLYEDLDLDSCVNFWTKILDISSNQLTHVHRRKGKEHGKLKYGICRLRIIKGGWELKQIMSLAKSTITLLDLSPRSSMDRAQGS